MVEIASQNTVFAPPFRTISDIVRGAETVVTTSFDHGYITGIIVRFYIPLQWGIQQLNGLQAAITVTSATQFSVKIDSLQFDTFVTPIDPTQFAQCVPIGEITSIFWAPKNNIITR